MVDRPRRSTAVYGSRRRSGGRTGRGNGTGSDAEEIDGVMSDGMSEPSEDSDDSDVYQEAKGAEEEVEQDQALEEEEERLTPAKRGAKRKASQKNSGARTTKKGKEVVQQTTPMTELKSMTGGARRARKVQRAVTPSDQEDDEDDGEWHSSEGAGEDEEERERIPSKDQLRSIKTAFYVLVRRLQRCKEPGQRTAIDPRSWQTIRVNKADLKLLIDSVQERMTDKEIEEMLEGGTIFGQGAGKGQNVDTIGFDQFKEILFRGGIV